MKSLSQRQRDALSFIHESVTKRGFPPTLRELAERLQIPDLNKGAGECLNALEKKGMIERGREARGIRVTDAGFAALLLPTPTEMRAAVNRSERLYGLLIRSFTVLQRAVPTHPLLDDMRSELAAHLKIETDIVPTLTDVAAETGGAS